MDDQKIEAILQTALHDVRNAESMIGMAMEAVKRAQVAGESATEKLARDMEKRAHSILVGGTMPTAAEIAAHYATGGKWRVVEHQCERVSNGRTHTRLAAERTLSNPEHIEAYKWEIEEWKIPTTWWALDKSYLLTTWPQVEAQPFAAEPKVIGEARIEPLVTPGLILTGMPEEIVSADAEWLLARSGARYSRRDGISVKAEFRITPSDLAKINAALAAASAPRGPRTPIEHLMDFEKGQEGMR